MILERDFKLVVNLKKILRIKKQYGLVTKIRKKNQSRFIANGKGEHVVVPNLLQRRFNVEKKDRIYSTDITHLEYGHGQKAYMSAVKDLGTKEIIIHTVSRSINMEIALRGLDSLLKNIPLKVRKNLIIHSDQGTHYTHQAYRQKLQKYKVQQSMSRRGNCLDNAPIESFFGHMKDELNLKSYKSYEDLTTAVNQFIEYYNEDRPQWNLKGITPAERRELLTF
jgi:putative transposase